MRALLDPQAVFICFRTSERRGMMGSEEERPHSVVNKPQIGEQYGALDGRVGAFVNNYFVTTPNCNVIYTPQLGRCNVFMHSDYCYGEDDPLHYPQPFIVDRCHYAALPPHLPPNDPARKWWDPPSESAFHKEIDSVINGMGTWDPLYLAKFSSDYEVLQKHVSIYWSSRVNTNTFIEGLSPHLEHMLRQLTSLSLPYLRACELFSYFQRWYLELGAALDWVEVYQPLMLSTTVQPDCKTANTMGTFLFDLKHCKMFALAGLPFWLVRPLEHHSSARIDTQVVPLTLQGLNVILDGFQTRSGKVIFSGAGSDKAKAIAMENYSHSIVTFVDPFAVVSEADDHKPHSSSSNMSSVAGATSRSQSRKSKKSGGCSPYEKPQQIAKTEQNKFSEVGGQYSPAVPEVWVQVLGGIDQSKQPPKEAVLNSGYAFPEPGLFLFAGLTFQDRMLQYVKTWLCFCSVLIFQHQLPFILPTASPAAYGAWSPKQWCTLLALHGKTSNSGIIQSHERKVVDDLLAESLKFFDMQMELANVEDYHFTWHDFHFPIGRLTDPAIIKEIIWELFELNFQFEFHALNSKLCHNNTQLPTSVHDLTTFDISVQSCFPGLTGIWNPMQISWAQLSMGLAASDLRKRVVYFLKMRDIVKDWPGGSGIAALQSTKATVDEHTDMELSEMEQAVA
ncbi:hypothetical protein Moror_15064 [Moniliophthora roreri MCA 2997]|uniref:Uncharacterized protein n=2 Tax=Moniliophthora roreri TaxID=221103 RepID=V2WST3_MONRO|nr:hypothetical protein Moror_15064 [Moniliophthora roreri MCA 2997]